MKTFSQSKCTPVLLVFLATTVFLHSASGQGSTPPTPVTDFESRLVGGSGSQWFNDALVVGGRGVFVGYRQESSLGNWGYWPVVVRTDDGLDVKRLDLQPTLDGAANNSASFELRAVAYGNGQWMALGQDSDWNNGSRVWRSKDNAVTLSDSSQQGGMPVVEKISGMGQYWGLAYGNGTWVAVGYQAYSPATGIVSYLREPAQDSAMSMWQSAMLPMGADAQPAALRKVCFGNGTFVAIGDKGAIYSSVDGQNWLERSSGVAENLHGVAYGNGAFVVVGQAGSALVSKNSGQSWTRYELPVGGGEGIAFDGTVFGVEGSVGFAVSRDGEIWVAGSTSSGGSAWPRPLAAGANLGWLTDLGGDTFSQSVKGSTPQINQPDSSLLGEVGKALASYQIKTQADSSTLKASAYKAFGMPPGLTFNTTTGVISGTPTASGNYRAVVYAGNANGFGGYAFVPFAIGKVGSTPPAPVLDFESRFVGGSASQWFNDALVVGGRGVLVGYRQESSLGNWGYLPVVVRTDDGLDVKRLDLQPTLDGAASNNSASFELRAVSYGNGQWMALGQDVDWNNGSRVWRSKDNAVTWSDSTQQGGMPMVEKISGMGQYWGLAYGNGTWVAVGYQAYSPATGIVSYLKEPAQDSSMSMWQSAMLPMGAGAQVAALRKVCFGNGTFVAIGDTGAIYTSVDGQNWMERSSGVTENLYGVAYGNGAFVVVGQGGSALVSKNSGQSWTRYELPVGGGQGIAFDGTVFGVEGSGGFAVSRDGEIWVAGGELSNGGSASPRPLAGSANLGWLRNWGGTSFSQSVKGDVSQIDEPDSSLLGEVGKAFVSYQIKTWSDSSTSKASLYRAFGLPPGLICNAATGVISGTPTASGNYRAVVYAGNVNGFGIYDFIPFAVGRLGFTPPTPVAGFQSRWLGGSGSQWFNDALVVGGRGVFVGYRQESSLGNWGYWPVVVRTDDGLDVKKLDLQPTLDGAASNNSASFELRAVAYGNGQWMALGQDSDWNNGSRVWRSKDNAVTLSDSSQQGGMPVVEKISGMGQYWGLAYGNGVWVAVGYQNYSPVTGIISYLREPAQDSAMSMWQSAMLPSSAGAQQAAALRKVCCGNGTFVAIGDNGAIYTSVDGQNWMERSSGVTENLYGVAYGNGAFVVVGQGGSALVSKNGGQSWTRYELPVGGGQGIAFDGTVFGVEGSGGFAVSRDGEIWVAGGELSNGGSASPRPLAGSANLGWLRNWGGTSFSQSVKGDVSQIDEPDSSLLGEVGKAFVSYQIKTWSDSSTSKASLYRVFGLPPGLRCNSATGVISGTPMASGNYRAVVYAGNVNGFGSYGMASFAISPAIPLATWTWSSANTSTPIQIGGSAFFGVENVTGSGAISYQWLKNGKPLPGKNSPTLELNAVSLADSGNYALVITTAAGKVTTESQKLVIENSGLAIYKLTGRGNWIEASGRKPISFGGYILVDLTTMEGRGIFTMDHKTYGKYQTELSSSAFVMSSSGPWQGSTSLLSSVSDSEEAPAYEVISFSGMDALIALDKSKTILAPSTMAGFIHGYLQIAGTSGKALEVLTASLTLDKPQTLNAANSSETLEEAYDRLTLELVIKGFELNSGIPTGGSGTPPRPTPSAN